MSDNEYEYEREEPISICLRSSAIQVIFSKLAHLKYFRENYTLNEIKSRLSVDLLKIEDEKHIKEESIIIFFNILHGKIPEILTNDEYIDFFKLSSLFHVSKASSVSKFIKKYSISHLSNLEFNIQVLISSINDPSISTTFGENYLIQLEDS